MEWLAILGLAAWVGWQSRRISALTRRLEELGLNAVLHADAPAPRAPATPPAQGDDTLLLDTPLPVASNDVEELTETAAPAVAFQEPPASPSAATSNEDAPIPFPPAAATPPPRVARAASRSLEKWLAENGFAWLGGALLALGGVFLVSFAAQQAWFTPSVQLACALAFGLALIVAGEWARGRQPLVASMLAAAGVTTLYAAAWAAHGLYGVIDPLAAAAALSACALILAALALRHGQALGVLAVAMALLAPPFASMGLWPTTGLTLYVCAIAIAGLGLAAWRRWAWAAAATTLGLYFWFAAAIATDDVRRALTLASVAAVGGVAMAFRRERDAAAQGLLGWGRIQSDLPAIAISASSVLTIWTWLSMTAAQSGAVTGVAWVSASLAALAAAAVRARAAAPASFAVAMAGLVLGFMAYLRARHHFAPLGADFYPAILACSVVAAASALYARPHRSGRALLAASGAIGAALLACLAAASRSDWHAPAAWLPLFLTAAMLFAAAWVDARDTREPGGGRAVAFWAGAGAALTLLGIESAFPAIVRSVAHAGAALVFAAALMRSGWAVLRFSALAAAALAIGHAFSPEVVALTLSGAAAPLAQGLALLACTALLLFAASAVAARREPRAYASEGLAAGGVIVALVGVFLALRWFAAGGAGTQLSFFDEASLQALALIAAGAVTTPRQSEQTGLIAKWRGHVLMGTGLLYALLSAGLAQNPWWGMAPAAIVGPPLLNALALGMAAPAALALAAARRLYASQPNAARAYAASGGVLALMWAILEIRRGFHGQDMASGALGLLEAAAYGLLLLASALALARAGKRADGEAPASLVGDLGRIGSASAWAASLAAVYLMLALRHPWWGDQNGGQTGDVATLLAVLAQAAAAALALAIGRSLSQSERIDSTRFASAATAALFAWSFGHAAIHWLVHRGRMDDGVGLAGVESFAHALWPLAFVLGASALTVRALSAPAQQPGAAKSFGNDLQAIWAAAVWPSFIAAAFGLWVLHNPWWGWTPASIASLPPALGALASYAGAAWMSALASRAPHARWPLWLMRLGKLAAVGHGFVALTLAARWLRHGAAMDAAPVGGVEMWTYSAVWAVYGAGLFWLGARREDALLRWSGLGLLLLTTAKVFLFDMAQLSGVVRVGSFVGLGAVLLGVAWAARRRSQE